MLQTIESVDYICLTLTLMNNENKDNIPRCYSRKTQHRPDGKLEHSRESFAEWKWTEQSHFLFRRMRVLWRRKKRDLDKIVNDGGSWRNHHRRRG